MKIEKSCYNGSCKYAVITNQKYNHPKCHTCDPNTYSNWYPADKICPTCGGSGKIGGMEG